MPVQAGSIRAICGVMMILSAVVLLATGTGFLWTDYRDISRERTISREKQQRLIDIRDVGRPKYGETLAELLWKPQTEQQLLAEKEYQSLLPLDYYRTRMIRYLFIGEGIVLVFSVGLFISGLILMKKGFKYCDIQAKTNAT